MRTGCQYRSPEERMERNGPEVVENDEKQEEIRRGLFSHDLVWKSDGIGFAAEFIQILAALRHILII